MQIEEGASDTTYILVPSNTGGSEFNPVPTVRPINENVPVELNNFRFEEMDNDTTDFTAEPEPEPEPAVVTSV
jgi:hypothetical protein